jgi:ATP-dependent DNA ligase
VLKDPGAVYRPGERTQAWLKLAHTGEADHSDRLIVNAPIGDRDRSVATLAGRSAVELCLLSP